MGANVTFKNTFKVLIVGFVFFSNTDGTITHFKPSPVGSRHSLSTLLVENVNARFRQTISPACTQALGPQSFRSLVMAAFQASFISLSPVCFWMANAIG